MYPARTIIGKYAVLTKAHVLCRSSHMLLQCRCDCTKVYENPNGSSGVLRLVKVAAMQGQVDAGNQAEVNNYNSHTQQLSSWALKQASKQSRSVSWT